MAKLYPPYIEGTIPAFFKDDDGTVILTVPLSMNKAVGAKEVKGFVLKIKTAQTGLLLGTIESDSFDLISNLSVWFDLEEIKDKLIEGQYYKVQIAYVNEDGVGYYSTVGVAKYTTMPTVAIEGLDFKKINNHQYKYLGTYSQKNKDITERVYSYRFDMYDINRNMIATSGDIIHNRNNDINNYESQDEWYYENDISKNEPYYIRYTVKTLNNLTVATNSYRVMQKETIDPEAKIELTAAMNFDNAYVDINLVGFVNEGTGKEDPISGSFVICRASDDQNYQNWAEVFRFNLGSATPSRWLWRDYTVEQGCTYIYSIQQYNDYDLYSNRILSNEVYADFEDAFLFDGERQLKIRYNPKVSSFKNTIYETKVDTIGGKHPFIFRNNTINYKEFPISGMISYYMDEEELFMKQEEYNLKNKTTDLTGDNLASERIFKLEVLDWLTNGEPKLFRSPSEGNYIVRLLNVSMAPQDPLGRMLHTFSATAYEITEYNFENLAAFGLIKIETPDMQNLQWQTIRFWDINNNDKLEHVPYGNPYLTEPSGEYIAALENGKRVYLDAKKNLLRLSNGSNLIAKTVIFQDMLPGDRVIIVQEDKYHLNPICQAFQIGATGAYQVESPVGIIGIFLYENKPPYGNLLFSYYSSYGNMFNLYYNVEVGSVPIKQFFGSHRTDKEYKGNIISSIENVKTELLYFYEMLFEKRPMENVYAEIRDGKYVFSFEKVNGVLGPIIDMKKDLDPYYIYRFEEGKRYRYLDGKDGKIYDTEKANESITTIKIDDNPEIDIEETTRYYLENFGDIKELRMGIGVMLTAAYLTRTYTYNLEIDPNAPLSDEALLKRLQEQGKKIQQIQDNYENAKKQLENKEISLEAFIDIEEKYFTDYAANYSYYIKLLEETLETYKEDNMIYEKSSIR